MDPQTPYLSPKYFKKYKKIMGTSQKNIILSYLNILEIQENPSSGHPQTPPKRKCVCFLAWESPPPPPPQKKEKIFISKRFWYKYPPPCLQGTEGVVIIFYLAFFPRPLALAFGWWPFDDLWGTPPWPTSPWWARTTFSTLFSCF